MVYNFKKERFYKSIIIRESLTIPLDSICFTEERPDFVTSENIPQNAKGDWSVSPRPHSKS